MAGAVARQWRAQAGCVTSPDGLRHLVATSCGCPQQFLNTGGGAPASTSKPEAAARALGREPPSGLPTSLGWAAAHPRAGRQPPCPGAPQHKHKHKHKVSSQQASARSRVARTRAADFLEFSRPGALCSRSLACPRACGYMSAVWAPCRALVRATLPLALTPYDAECGVAEAKKLEELAHDIQRQTGAVRWWHQGHWGRHLLKQYVRRAAW